MVRVSPITSMIGCEKPIACEMPNSSTTSVMIMAVPPGSLLINVMLAPVLVVALASCGSRGIEERAPDSVQQPQVARTPQEQGAKGDGSVLRPQEPRAKGD